MATEVLHDLFDGITHHVIADSTEYFRMSLFNYETSLPIDLNSVSEIEWYVGSASVKNRYSEIEKKFSRNEIIILKDVEGKKTNVIQVVLNANETVDFQGGYIHQLLITDSAGKRFRPMQGILVFSRALLSSI